MDNCELIKLLFERTKFMDDLLRLQAEETSRKIDCEILGLPYESKKIIVKVSNEMGV